MLVIIESLQGVIVFVSLDPGGRAQSRLPLATLCRAFGAR
jgi:hypothetical protein